MNQDKTTEQAAEACKNKTAVEILNDLASAYVNTEEDQFLHLAGCEQQYMQTASVSEKACIIYANQQAATLTATIEAQREALAICDARIEELEDELRVCQGAHIDERPRLY